MSPGRAELAHRRRLLSWSAAAHADATVSLPGYAERGNPVHHGVNAAAGGGGDGGGNALLRRTRGHWCGACRRGRNHGGVAAGLVAGRGGVRAPVLGEVCRARSVCRGRRRRGPGAGRGCRGHRGRAGRHRRTGGRRSDGGREGFGLGRGRGRCGLPLLLLGCLLPSEALLAGGSLMGNGKRGSVEHRRKKSGT